MNLVEVIYFIKILVFYISIFKVIQFAYLFANSIVTSEKFIEPFYSKITFWFAIAYICTIIHIGF